MNRILKSTKAKTSIKGSTEAHQALVREIVLRLNGRAVIWKQAVGAGQINGRYIAFGVKGAADLTGILRDGTRLEIEVKTGKARQTPHQVEYQRMIEGMGGIYLVARSGTDLIEALGNICKQRRIDF